MVWVRAGFNQPFHHWCQALTEALLCDDGLTIADFVENRFDRAAPDDETGVGHVEALVVEERGD